MMSRAVLLAVLLAGCSFRHITELPFDVAAAHVAPAAAAGADGAGRGELPRVHASWFIVQDGAKVDRLFWCQPPTDGTKAPTCVEAPIE